MTDHHRLLDLTIASPCTADWKAMAGDDKRRFCQQCHLHVHDLSAMTSDEASAVLRAAGSGRVCVRFHRRHDGTVLTQDCPVGLRQRLRRARARATAAVSAVFAALLTLLGCTRDDARPTSAHGTPVDPPATQPDLPALQGEVAVPVHEMGDAATPPTMGRVAAPVVREPR